MDSQLAESCTSLSLNNISGEEQLAMSDCLTEKTTTKVGAFSNCPEFYDGTKNVGELDRFIIAVIRYMDSNKISTEDAFEDFSTLLGGTVKSCWEKEKSKNPTILHAIKWLKFTYAPNTFDFNPTPGSPSSDFLRKITTVKVASFSNCPAFYDGTEDEGELYRFIADVFMYKDSNNISDEDAVENFSKLLCGTVKSRWEKEKLKNPTFLDAIKWLKLTYDPKKPAYMVYQDIINLKQRNMSLREFVEAKRKLFSQLSFDNIEQMQLDLVYAQLPKKYTSIVPRETLSNLNELLEKADYIESQLIEGSLKEAKNGNSSMRKKNRCSICKNLGHTADNCRKKFDAPKQNPKYACYGCGAPGIVRTKCPDCAPKIPTASSIKGVYLC